MLIPDFEKFTYQNMDLKFNQYIIPFKNFIVTYFEFSVFFIKKNSNKIQFLDLTSYALFDSASGETTLIVLMHFTSQPVRKEKMIEYLIK